MREILWRTTAGGKVTSVASHRVRAKLRNFAIYNRCGAMDGEYVASALDAQLLTLPHS